jgi:hypothetical protein
MPTHEFRSNSVPTMGCRLYETDPETYVESGNQYQLEIERNKVKSACLANDACVGYYEQDIHGHKKFMATGTEPDKCVGAPGGTITFHKKVGSCVDNHPLCASYAATDLCSNRLVFDNCARSCNPACSGQSIHHAMPPPSQVPTISQSQMQHHQQPPLVAAEVVGSCVDNPLCASFAATDLCSNQLVFDNCARSCNPACSGQSSHHAMPPPSFRF